MSGGVEYLLDLEAHVKGFQLCLSQNISDIVTDMSAQYFSATQSRLLNQHHRKRCESQNGNFVPNGLPETGSAELEPLSILHL